MRIAIGLLLAAIVLGGLGVFVSALHWLVIAALAMFVIGAVTAQPRRIDL